MIRKGQRGMRVTSGRKERGAVAIMVALALVALIGFVGLALDLGKLYVVRSELQNSADSCALAAARDLTGATIDLSVPEAAGIAAGHYNYAFFQTAPVQLSTDSNVLFSDSLNNAFLPKSSVSSPSTMKYVKCKTSLTNIPNWFIQVLNMLPGVSIGNSAVSAFAVATLSPAQTTCGLPVFVCTPGTGPTYGTSYTPGTWIGSKDGPTPAFGPGSFGWAALDGSNSAQSIKNELTGNFCSIPATGFKIGTAGNKSADSGAYNTRFGIYDNPYNQSGAAPDFTGYAYKSIPAGQTSAYSDFVTRRASFTGYQNSSDFTVKGSSSGTNYALGSDRRLALAPEVDCSLLDNGSSSPTVHQLPVIRWDCVLMVDPMQWLPSAPLPIHLEYEGKSTDASVPCATHGVPGNSNSVGPLVPVLLQ
jgi:hypothetical protein